MATICPNCASPLVFSPEHKALYCSRCGGVFAPEQLQTEGRDLLEYQEILDHQDVYGYTEEQYEEGEFNIYSCSSCGGEIVINSTEASTYCIFCGSPSIVFNRVSKFRKPKFIMPFKVSREEAERLIRSNIANNKYVPEEIKNFKVDSIRGIYIPYQIVDVEYRDAMFIQGEVGSGKHRRTVFYTRAGKCIFHDLPVEASSKLNDGVSVKLEPYYLKDLVPFDEDYLTGFYSDMCDLSRPELDQTIKVRLYTMFLEKVKKSIRGKFRKVLYSRPFILHKRAPQYAMLPVWFITFFYEDKPHTVLVNGQTGKVVCGLPWKKKKVRREIFWGGMLITTVLAIIGRLIYAMDPSPSSGADVDIYGITLFFSIFLIAAGIAKFKKTKKSIEQTQSTSMFKFVKKRQG